MSGQQQGNNNPDMWASLLSAATMSEPVNGDSKNGGNVGDGGASTNGGDSGPDGGRGNNNTTMAMSPAGVDQQQAATGLGGSPFDLHSLQQYRTAENSPFGGSGGGGGPSPQQEQFGGPPQQDMKAKARDLLLREQQIREQYQHQIQSDNASSPVQHGFTTGPVMGAPADEHPSTTNNNTPQVHVEVVNPPKENEDGAKAAAVDGDDDPMDIEGTDNAKGKDDSASDIVDATKDTAMANSDGKKDGDDDEKEADDEDVKPSEEKGTDAAAPNDDTAPKDVTDDNQEKDRQDTLEGQITALEEQKKLQEEQELQENEKKRMEEESQKKGGELDEQEQQKIDDEEQQKQKDAEEEQERKEEEDRLRKEEEQARMDAELRKLEEEELQRQLEVERQEEERKRKEEEEAKKESADTVNTEKTEPETLGVVEDVQKEQSEEPENKESNEKANDQEKMEDLVKKMSTQPNNDIADGQLQNESKGEEETSTLKPDAETTISGATKDAADEKVDQGITEEPVVKENEKTEMPTEAKEGKYAATIEASTGGGKEEEDKEKNVAMPTETSDKAEIPSQEEKSSPQKTTEEGTDKMAGDIPESSEPTEGEQEKATEPTEFDKPQPTNNDDVETDTKAAKEGSTEERKKEAKESSSLPPTEGESSAPNTGETEPMNMDSTASQEVEEEKPDDGSKNGKNEEANGESEGKDIAETRKTKEKKASSNKAEATVPPKYMMTPNQIYLNRCRKCALCLKEDCLTCKSCSNSLYLAKSRKQVCFRKMCCEIDVVQKAQPMPRFPDGWFFWFEKPEDSSTGDSELEGLVLYSPQNKKVVAADFVGNDDSSSVFPDVEDLESRLRDFYEYIGYLDRSRKRRSVKYNLDDFAATVEDAEPAPTKSKKRGASMSPKPASKRYKQTVKKRSSTTSEASSSSSWQGEVNQKPPPEKDEEPEIGDRVYSCFDDEDNWYWGKVTDKFMKGDSVRYSIQYDDGDFIEDFDPIRGIATESHYKAGMVPDDPDACKLDDGTVERKGSNSWVSKIEYARKSRFLGTFRTKEEATTYLASVKKILESFGKTRDALETMSDNQGRKAVQRARYEAEALLGITSKKGGEKSPSAKPPTTSGSKRKRRKTSDEKEDISLEQIIQGSLKSLDESVKARPKMKASKLTGSFNERSKMKAAKSTNQEKPKEAITSSTDILIGRGICQQWTDLHNRNKTLFGVITHCDQNDDGDKSNTLFTVAYDENSRSLVNSMPNECGSLVPATRKLKSEIAWGGCLLFEDHRYPLKGKKPLRSMKIPIAAWNWITPDMRYEELGDIESNKLPKLTLGVRGYQLIFSVKQSSIPNAGLGVFVKAANCIDGAKSPFQLQQGEMLDLGIYAPFLARDEMKETAFFVKNFIHSFAIEEWGFNTVEEHSMFDITDDHSGKIHEQAKRHLPAYVNECSSKDEPTIRAEHDPEGNVHYVFGVLNEEKLSIPADGDEIEVFVNYGPQYENVRLRKGYSGLPQDEQKKQLEKLANEDLEYLDDINNFSAEDVLPCITFFEKVNFNNMSPQVRQRSFKILERLDERYQKMLGSDAENAELKSCRERIKSLTSQLPECASSKTGSFDLELDQMDTSEGKKDSADNKTEETIENVPDQPPVQPGVITNQDPTDLVPQRKFDGMPVQQDLESSGLGSQAMGNMPVQQGMSPLGFGSQANQGLAQNLPLQQGMQPLGFEANQVLGQNLPLQQGMQPWGLESQGNQMELDNMGNPPGQEGLGGLDSPGNEPFDPFDD